MPPGNKFSIHKRTQDQVTASRPKLHFSRSPRVSLWIPHIFIDISHPFSADFSPLLTPEKISYDWPKIFTLIQRKGARFTTLQPLAFCPIYGLLERKKANTEQTLHQQLIKLSFSNVLCCCSSTHDDGEKVRSQIFLPNLLRYSVSARRKKLPMMCCCSCRWRKILLFNLPVQQRASAESSAV